ncbi:unnamed protein product [Peronospora belbahrii]|uniref:Uncharacterized protein n=1 Tax=Peronospora belbahrii TaxID=622444 RepID=A0ABN8CMC4_9STRA|nr:unnamed protein product [Peronospora belbahrii]
MTSMSQSSFSQAQSQNLLGSSQDDQLHRIQQWQTQQALPSFPPSPVRCNGNEKLQEVERNLNKAFVEQTQAQKQQQERLVTQIASPISKSMEEIKKQLVTSGEGQQKQEAVIGVLAKGIDNVTATVSELREQSRSNKATCQETRTAMVTEVAAVNAALTRLQARVDSVEGGVKVCSGHVTQVLEVIGTTHEALLSAISASSCNCPQDATQVNALSSAERATKKRRHNLSQPDLTETKTSRYVLTSIAESPTRPSAESPMQSGSLHLALQRIEALRAKRRSYLHDS